MSKHEQNLGKKCSASSEEKKSFWSKKADEMEVIQSILGGADERSFVVKEEPSETELGSFRVCIAPHCGMEIAGCSVELEMTYMDLDTTEMRFEVLHDRAEGLSDEQLEGLQDEISQCQREGAST